MAADPGWRGSWRGLAWMFLPGAAARRPERLGPDPLSALRALFVSFCSALVLFGVVLVVLDGSTGVGGGDGVATSTASAVVAALGVVVVAAAELIPRPLDCADEESLAASYRTRFFLRLALSESAALTGFVASFLAGSVVPYLVGLAVAGVGFARLAPTQAHLEADQERLNTQGCARSLLAALRRASTGR
jgi:hypothetical protein